jgi:hypothetical protein
MWETDVQDRKVEKINPGGEKSDGRLAFLWPSSLV